MVAELRSLGIAVGGTPGNQTIVPGVEPGGVAFSGSLESLYSANLHLRTASRVLVRVGEFRARALGELERRAKEQPWERFIQPGREVRLRVTCRKSRLYHSGAVAARVANAIQARVGGAAAIAPASGDDEGDDHDDAQLIVVRMLHDQCTLSVDASGALLHRRGYRLATAKAPLRETLAAALLLASEWDTDSPLLDPMCGAGTIAIEGALLARRIAPGLGRGFAFMEWPGFDQALWDRLLGEARGRILPSAPAPIQGSDRDAGAIEAAMANAERAGVAADVQLTRRAISAIDPPPGPGWLVTNPPYGARVGQRDRLRNLYAQLGNVARSKCPGWTITLLSADHRLDSQLAMPVATVLKTRNGGIAVRVVKGVTEEAESRE